MTLEPDPDFRLKIRSRSALPDWQVERLGQRTGEPSYSPLRPFKNLRRLPSVTVCPLSQWLPDIFLEEFRSKHGLCT